MALYRWLYRKRQTAATICFACSFWVIFLYLALQSPTGAVLKGHIPDTVVKSNLEILNRNKIIKAKQIMTHLDTISLDNSIQRVLRNSTMKIGNNILYPSNFMILSMPPSQNHIKFNKTHPTNKTASILSAGHKDSNLLQFGDAIRNKTLEVGQKLKNKTLEKLTDFGVINSRKRRTIIIESSIIDLTLSAKNMDPYKGNDVYFRHLREDMSNMKPMLPPGVNNITQENRINNKSVSLGHCECEDMLCLCCAQIELTLINLKKKVCSHLTFLPKSHDLQFQYLVDGKIYYNTTIFADQPPVICLGDFSKVASMCIKFFDMAFKVNLHDEHKSQISGRVDHSFTLYNVTIGQFTVDSFQIPSDKAKRSQESQVKDMGNWVP